MGVALSMSAGARDYSTLPPEWSDRPFEALVALAHDAEQRVGNGEAFPALRLRYRALWLTKPTEVRVVILGMDPYPNRGHADGLAFSYSGDGRLPASLNKVFARLPEAARRRSADLEEWATQGVLLLNVALSVKPGSPGSHIRFWRPFTTELITRLRGLSPDILYVLWGKRACEVADEAGVPQSKRMYFGHPCSSKPPKGAARFGDFDFSSLNRRLRRPVRWSWRNG